MDSLTTTRDDAGHMAALAPAPPSKAAMILRFVMAVLWTLVIMGLCWMPRSLVEEVEQGSRWFDIPNLDKVVHWGIFVVFAILWLRTGSSKGRYAWVALGGLALALTTELVQNLPAIGRDGSVDDTITDLIGVAIGLAVARRIEPILGRLESRLLRPLGR